MVQRWKEERHKATVLCFHTMTSEKSGSKFVEKGGSAVVAVPRVRCFLVEAEIPL